jgi:hypothetical protein
LRDEVIRSGLRDDGERRARHDGGQIAAAALEVHDHGSVALGANPQRLDIGRLASEERPGTHHVGGQRGERRRSFGVEQAPPAVDDVIGGERRAVAELQVRAQGEGDLPSVVRNDPGLGERRPDRERGIHGRERLEQLADIRRAAEVAVVCRIQ